jgi:hypothetical protein
MSGAVMINWKNVYIILGTVLGGMGTYMASDEILMLSVAFLGSGGLQAWLEHRAFVREAMDRQAFDRQAFDRRSPDRPSSGSLDPLAKPDSLIVGKP